MPIAPDEKNIYLGAGSIYFARLVDGVEDGIFHLGNCDTLAIETADDVLKLKDSMNREGGTLRAVARDREVRVSVQGNEYNADNMALVLMGEIGSLEQASGSVTAEVLTASAQVGRIYQTAFRDISSVVINVSASPMTEDTDYTVLDAANGLIQVLEGGAIADGDQLDADYDHAEIAAPGLQTVQGGSASVVEGRMLFVGDPKAGEVRDVEFWKVSVEPEGDVNLIGDEFGEWSLSAEVLNQSQDHPDEPFFRMVYTGEAR